MAELGFESGLFYVKFYDDNNSWHLCVIRCVFNHIQGTFILLSCYTPITKCSFNDLTLKEILWLALLNHGKPALLTHKALWLWTLLSTAFLYCGHQKQLCYMGATEPRSSSTLDVNEFTLPFKLHLDMAGSVSTVLWKHQLFSLSLLCS